jgi:lipoprotein NlpD
MTQPICTSRRRGRQPLHAQAAGTLVMAAMLLLGVLLAGCSSQRVVPVQDVRESRPAQRAPAASEFYVVRRGDSLSGIARAQGLELRQLLALNGLDSRSTIYVGQQLRVRAAAAAPSGQPSASGAEEGVVLGSAVPGGSLQARPLEGTSLSAAPLVPGTAPGSGLSPGAAQSPGAAAPAPGVRTEPRVAKLPYSETNLALLQNAAHGAPPAASGPASGMNPGMAPSLVPGGAGANLPGAVPPPAASVPAPAPAVPAPPTGVPASVNPAAASAGGTARGAASAPAASAGEIRFIWPLAGSLIGRFEGNSKGIDIAGSEGEPVRASAGGSVLYAGSGIRGYGQLLIIKHNDSFLSVYAHNRRLLVKQGDTVRQGQDVAEVGHTDADRPKLHFEVRRQGSSVDPLQYLPPR